MEATHTTALPLCLYLRPPPFPSSPPPPDNFSGCILSSSALGHGPWLSGGSTLPRSLSGDSPFPKRLHPPQVFPTSPNTHSFPLVPVTGLGQLCRRGWEGEVREEKQQVLCGSPTGETGPPPPSVQLLYPELTTCLCGSRVCTEQNSPLANSPLPASFQPVTRGPWLCSLQVLVGPGNKVPFNPASIFPSTHSKIRQLTLGASLWN